MARYKRSNLTEAGIPILKSPITFAAKPKTECSVVMHCPVDSHHFISSSRKNVTVDGRQSTETRFRAIGGATSSASDLAYDHDDTQRRSHNFPFFHLCLKFLVICAVSYAPTVNFQGQLKMRSEGPGLDGTQLRRHDPIVHGSRSDFTNYGDFGVSLISTNDTY